MPWRDTFFPSYSPLVKIGSMLSNSLTRLTSMPCTRPCATATLACQPSRSGMSTDFGWVMKRVSAAEVSRFCITTLKPRSFCAWSPIACTTE